MESPEKAIQRRRQGAYRALLALETRNNEMMTQVFSRASSELKNTTDMFRPELWTSLEHPHFTSRLQSSHAASLPQSSSLTNAIDSLEAACLNLTATSIALSRAIRPDEAQRSATTQTQTQRTQKRKPKTTGTTSAYFDPFSMVPTPPGLIFRLSHSEFGLIQERIRTNLWALVVQTILWNQTTAKAGRPVLFELLSRYSTPLDMAAADVNDVMSIIRCLGLQNKRSKLLIDLAKQWLLAPPDPSRRYARKHYPRPNDNLDLMDGILVEEDDFCPSFEIAHLPGVGPYAIDSYRIFYRDTLRGFGADPHEIFEPEWKRVLPQDKDLRAYLKWKWRSIGWDWDMLSGQRKKIAEETT